MQFNNKIMLPISNLVDTGLLSNRGFAVLELDLHKVVGLAYYAALANDLCESGTIQDTLEVLYDELSYVGHGQIDFPCVNLEDVVEHVSTNLVNNLKVVGRNIGLRGRSFGGIDRWMGSDILIDSLPDGHPDVLLSCQ